MPFPWPNSRNVLCSLLPRTRIRSHEPLPCRRPVGAKCTLYSGGHRGIVDVSRMYLPYCIGGQVSLIHSKGIRHRVCTGRVWDKVAAEECSLLSLVSVGALRLIRLVVRESCLSLLSSNIIRPSRVRSNRILYSVLLIYMFCSISRDRDTKMR